MRASIGRVFWVNKERTEELSDGPPKGSWRQLSDRIGYPPATQLLSSINSPVSVVLLALLFLSPETPSEGAEEKSRLAGSNGGNRRPVPRDLARGRGRRRLPGSWSRGSRRTGPQPDVRRRRPHPESRRRRSRLVRRPPPPRIRPSLSDPGRRLVIPGWNWVVFRVSFNKGGGDGDR